MILETVPAGGAAMVGLLVGSAPPWLQVWFLWWTPHFTAALLPSDLHAPVLLLWLWEPTQDTIDTQVSEQNESERGIMLTSDERQTEILLNNKSSMIFFSYH